MEILIENLSKNFSNVKAINRLSLRIGTGITGLMGQNGAGKSTLLRLIAGVIRRDEGEILIDGDDPESKAAKEKIFFLSDDPFTPSGSNIKELMGFYKCFYDFDEDRFNKLLSKTNLDAKRRLSNFSKGMRRQAFLILALSSKCPIILIDEGFDGLDPLILNVIKEELIELGEEGKIVLLSSHNLSSLERMADQFVLLSKGELGKQGAETDFSTKLTKYQAAFRKEISKEKLEEYGFHVINYRRIGQITNFVIIEDEGRIMELQKKENPLILERIPLETDEIFASQMLLAKERIEGKKDE